MNSFAVALKDRLTAKLPGWEAQFAMSPSGTRGYLKKATAPKLAAVMAALYFKNQELTLCFIERTSHDIRDNHAGQIAFPGGKLEESDNNNLELCAVRELQEELGIQPSQIQILGPLTRLYVYVSDFMVYPFVGFLEQAPSFQKQESEVASVLEIPVRQLMLKETKKVMNLPIRNIILKDVPYFDIHDTPLWGATAMIANELLTILAEFDQP